QRATRAIGHCEFSPEELIETFDDLVSWVEDDVVPGGDDILDPATVADPLFGCNYSRGTTATRPFAPCP
ncbi:MAG: alpha/beta hydrolase, partial [bacterium]|nr:alpha/beta hydrolase [bacterium]